MTIFRFSSAFAALSSLLAVSCGAPHRYPDTEIGRIFRLGKTDKIDAALVEHLMKFGGDVDAVSSELAESGFSGPYDERGCEVWQYSEAEKRGDRDGYVGMFRYTLKVMVSKCETKFKVLSVFYGL